MKLFKCILLLIFITGCKVEAINVSEVKAKADILFEKVSNGTAVTEFPVKYFPAEQTLDMVYELKNSCDFKNRTGNFLNEYYSADKSKLSLIYEFYLKCDSIRFILTYNLNDNVELFEFKLEAIEQNNLNITNVSKRLKF